MQDLQTYEPKRFKPTSTPMRVRLHQLAGTIYPITKTHRKDPAAQT